MPELGWRPLALLLGGSGVLHLIVPRVYEPLIPRRLGSARAWVIGSGVAELACAAALSRPATRRAGALASAGLFAAVFPGNVQMAVSAMRSERASRVHRAVALLRLPLQLPLVRWSLRIARAGEAS